MVRGKTIVGAAVLITALAGCGTQQHPGSAVARHPQMTQHHVPATATGRRRATISTRRVHMPDDTDDEPHAATAQLSAARPVARALFASYIAYLYGRRPARHVVGADQRLRAQLDRGRATLTPAERAARPHLAHLSITSAGPPVSVVAVALVNVGRGPSSRLTATLEPRRGKWVVVAIAG
jgi:hypothetical protein